MSTNRNHRNKKFVTPGNNGLVPAESMNQFAILERQFFPERFDDTGTRKPATPRPNFKPKHTGESASNSPKP